MTKPAPEPRTADLDLSRGDTYLPPAGDERREELKRRDDELAEKIETQTPEAYKLDPEKIKPDREAIAEIGPADPMYVSDPEDGFVYKWVYTGYYGNLVQHAKWEGWQVVKGEMHEARERIHEDTTRRIVDTILVRIPIEKYNALLKKRAELQRAREEGATANLEQLAMKHGLVFDPNYLPENVRREFLANVAQGKMTDMLKQGTVPGLRGRR